MAGPDGMTNNTRKYTGQYETDLDYRADSVSVTSSTVDTVVAFNNFTATHIGTIKNDGPQDVFISFGLNVPTGTAQKTFTLKSGQELFDQELHMNGFNIRLTVAGSATIRYEVYGR